MKILYVTTISTTVNAFLIPHIKMLVEQGHHVDIATHLVGAIDDSLIELGCRVFDIPFSRSPLSIENKKAYNELKVIMNKGYDIIHTHTPIASMLVRQAAIKLRKQGVVVIYTAHGFHFHKGAPLKNWLIYYPIEKYGSKYTDVMITINKEDYKRATGKLLAKHNYLIDGVGVDLKKFSKIEDSSVIKSIRRTLDVQESDVVLTYVAELNANKNQMLLLKMMDHLVKINPSYKLLLVGEGILKQDYESYIKENNLTSNVFLLGQRNDIRDILSITDIYVASSKREGLPVNIIEAMAAGLPVVALVNRGHCALLEKDINSILIQHDDPVEFADVIQSLVSKDNLSSHQENAIEAYSVDVVCLALKDIYENIEKEMRGPQI